MESLISLIISLIIIIAVLIVINIGKKAEREKNAETNTTKTETNNRKFSLLNGIVALKTRIGIMLSIVWVVLCFAFGIDYPSPRSRVPHYDFTGFFLGIIPLALGWGIVWIIDGLKKQKKGTIKIDPKENKETNSIEDVEFTQTDQKAGDSIENAIIIKAPNSALGITEEFKYIERICGKENKCWTMELQKLLVIKNRFYDEIIIKMNDGMVRKFYFDITDFHGKY